MTVRLRATTALQLVKKKRLKYKLNTICKKYDKRVYGDTITRYKSIISKKVLQLQIGIHRGVSNKVT